MTQSASKAIDFGEITQNIDSGDGRGKDRSEARRMGRKGKGRGGPQLINRARFASLVLYSMDVNEQIIESTKLSLFGKWWLFLNKYIFKLLQLPLMHLVKNWQLIADFLQLKFAF